MRKNITITKNLTEHRVNFKNEVREKFRFRNVWTHGRQVLFKDKNDGKKIKIYYD